MDRPTVDAEWLILNSVRMITSTRRTTRRLRGQTLLHGFAYERYPETHPLPPLALPLDTADDAATLGIPDERDEHEVPLMDEDVGWAGHLRTCWRAYRRPGDPSTDT